MSNAELERIEAESTPEEAINEETALVPFPVDHESVDSTDYIEFSAQSTSDVDVVVPQTKDAEPSKAVSEESLLRREAESPTDLKRIKWEEVDLLFLKTDQGTPFEFKEPKTSYERLGMYLDFSFVQGHINKQQYDYFSNKCNIFVNAYKNKIRNINALMDDNVIFTATLKDHKKIEEWFESMPVTMDAKEPGIGVGGVKQELLDIRKERLNAIAYRLVLGTLAEQEEKWTKEVERMTADRNFLIEEIKKYSPEGGMTSQQKQVANLMAEKSALEEELTEVQSKAKAIDDFTHGIVARNELLETKLGDLEIKFSEEKKYLTDLELEIDRTLKTRNELVAKTAAMEKTLDDLNVQRLTCVKQFQKLQFDTNKENNKSKVIMKQVEATNVEQQLWEVRVIRSRDRMEKCMTKKRDLDKAIEAAKQEFRQEEKCLFRERAGLEKLENAVKQQEKTVASIKDEIEVEKTKLAALKESAKKGQDPDAVANARQKFEKEIDTLRKDIINQARLHVLERQEFVRIYGELKKLQQKQWALRKVFQDNIGKIRKSRVEQLNQIDTIKRLSHEIENQKMNIKWVNQQMIADEKLLAKKNQEFRKIVVEYRNERLEKSKDLQEHSLKLQSINEWKEINRVGDKEEEELKSLKMQLMAKREDLHKTTEDIHESTKMKTEDYRETKRELIKSRTEYEAREIGMKKIKLELYKKQLEMERVIHKFTEAAAERNYKSMKLNDILREHVCYTEHISTTEEMIRRADWELITRMDVITRLGSIKKMEMLGMDKLREKLETWQGMLDYLDDLFGRFEQVIARQIEMQNKFQGSRHRIVREKQMEDPKEVQRKLVKLEDRVQFKEEKILELKLLTFQTNKLLEDLQKNKDEKLELAQASTGAMIDIKRKNIEADNKTKQLMVEISLKKAMAESLKREYEDSKRRYEEAVANFEKGLPPTKEFEIEWQKMSRKGSEIVKDITTSLRPGDYLEAAMLVPC